MSSPLDFKSSSLNFGKTSSSDSLALTKSDEKESRPPTLDFSSMGGSPSLAVGLVSDSMSRGMLSAGDDAKRRREIDAQIREVGKQLIAARAQIDEAIKQFLKATRAVNAKASEHVWAMLDNLTADRGVTQEDINLSNFIDNIAKQERNRYFETAKALMDLEAINSEGKLGQYGKVIGLVFDARMQELKVLSERIKLVKDVEDHHLEIEIAVRNQILKEQTQAFDQWVSVQELSDQRKQSEMDMRLKEREQKLKEEIDLRELCIKEKGADAKNEREDRKLEYETELKKLKLEHDEKIETTKLEDAKEIEKHKINAEKSIENTRTAAKLTSDLAETATKVIKPTSNCNMM